MAEHPWIEEEINCGHLGQESFWKCPVCGVCGGPVWPQGGRMRAFIPEVPLKL